jgi:hypothetical protein
MYAGRADIDRAAVSARPPHRSRPTGNDPVEATTYAQVLRAQNLIGNRAVTHLLGGGLSSPDAAQQAEPAPTPEPAAVQRKIGFEFEDRHWNSWRHRATDDGDQVETVKRKETLHNGPHYRIEGEDSFAHLGATTIEVVTEPFEETAEGVASLTQSMDDVKRRVQQLDHFAGKRPGPDIQPGRHTYPMPPESPEPRFVRRDEHEFSGSGGLAADAILLSGGTPGFRIAMQYTAGLALRDIPEALETAGTNPREPRSDVRRRQRVRQQLYPPRDNTANLRSVGEAPGRASALAARLEDIPAYADALDGDQSDLVGFLSALVLTVDRLQTSGELQSSMDYVKIRLPQMPRNNFVQMLRAVPEAQRVAIEKAPDVLAEQLVALLRENHDQLALDSALIPPNTVTDGDDDATRAGTHVATLTVREWIRGIAHGTDHLSTAGMREWLRPLDIPEAERTRAADSLESVGALESVDTRTEDGESLFQFENRRVKPALPDGETIMTMPRAATAAIEILDYFAKLYQSRRPR